MSNIFRSHKVSFHSRRTLSRPLVMSPPGSTALLPSIGNVLPSIENGTDRSDPTWFESYKWFLFSSYFNVLLIFVPLSALAHHLNWDVSLRFGFSFFAIVPLAKVPTLLPANDGTALSIFVSLSLASWWCYWANVYKTWRDTCWFTQCIFWKRGRNYCRHCSLAPRLELRVLYKWRIKLFTSYFRWTTCRANCRKYCSLAYSPFSERQRDDTR